jgi:hypothetical protein
MIRLISVGTLVAAVWLSTSLLAWVDVRDFHSDESALIGTLIGSELNPLTSLVPLIVLLVSLIARYRLLSRSMAVIASVISGAVIAVLLLTNWSDASAVIELISSSTGLATAAGFGVVIRFGYWIYVAMAGLTTLVFALAVFQPGRSRKPEQLGSSAETSPDPQNLWDEQ